MTAPVLFLIFNRPRQTERVFDVIRQARPSRLYLAADGPRASRVDEAALCEEARRIATRVDWDCDMKTFFRSENLGCRKAVSGAITWFFEQEAEGIILEDDCLPHPTFFPFCTELLDRYRDDPRVMSVCGSNFAWPHFTRPSYYFSHYADIWGWASWRRAWVHYDEQMAAWPDTDIEQMMSSLFADNPNLVRHWATCFEKTYTGKIDTWDYQWIFAVMRRAGYAAYPTVNLISNLGFGADATHTRSANPMSCRRTFPVPAKLRHPHSVSTIRYLEVDTMQYRHGVPRAPAPIMQRALRRGRDVLLRAHPQFDLAHAQGRLYRKGALVKRVRRLFGDVTAGALAYYLYPEQRTPWGGPFNGQHGRLAIYNALMQRFSPKAIVETGTYHGTTTELFAKSGLPVFTIERNAYDFGFSKARFWRTLNVAMFKGDSREALRRMMRKELHLLRDAVIFAYLDAHWNDDLPLAEEIDLIFGHVREAIVMIDDFEVPFDAGYAFDDYGAGKALTADYLAAVAGAHGLGLFYPRLPSAQETGSRRGCVVLARSDIHGSALRGERLLRSADE